MIIRYRPRKASDDAFLVRSTLKTMKQVFEQSVGIPLDEKTILTNIHSSDTTLIIETKNKPIGYICYSDDGQGRMYLGSLILMPVVQSKGLGSRIVQDIMRDARLRGVQVIDCHVQTANRRALNFWHKHGWQIVGQPVGGSYELRRWLSSF